MSGMFLMRLALNRLNIPKPSVLLGSIGLILKVTMSCSSNKMVAFVYVTLGISLSEIYGIGHLPSSTVSPIASSTSGSIIGYCSVCLGFLLNLPLAQLYRRDKRPCFLGGDTRTKSSGLVLVKLGLSDLLVPFSTPKRLGSDSPIM